MCSAVLCNFIIELWLLNIAVSLNWKSAHYWEWYWLQKAIFNSFTQIEIFSGIFSSKPSLKNRSTIFTLGNRGSILTTELEAPIIVPHAAQKSELRVSTSAMCWTFYVPYLSHPGILGVTLFLYLYVCRRRPHILVHTITFEQLFGFLSFLARLLALTCRLPD